MAFFASRGRGARRHSLPARRFKPTLNSGNLEPRLLLAAGPLGVNLAGTLGYVDLMKETRAWIPLTASGLPTDANGWPQADAQILVLDERVNQPFNGPDSNAPQPNIGGLYHLSFQGQATVSPDWLKNYTVQNQVYNPATNTTTADLLVDQNTYQMLYIDFRNTVNSASSNGAGVSNVKLIQPGYAADTTQVFTNTMIKDLAPFGTLRYLNIDQANNYNPVNDANGKLIPLDWSQRKLPSASSQSSGPGQPGQAWEYMVGLANATNTDMWINIPGAATDDYVTQLASLIKNGDTVGGVTYAGLNPNLKVYLEFSNEVWGGSYLPYAENIISARQQVAAGNSPLNNDGTPDDYVWAGRNYLQRTMQITTDFRSVFGADPSYTKIRPVLGWSEGNYQFYPTTFAWFEKTYGAPNQYFYGLGNANYSNPTDFSSVDNLINSLTASLTQQAALTQKYATIANFYGMQTVAYEGGPSTGDGTTAAAGQVALAASRDPRMENFIVQEYNTWFANGGNLATLYDGPYDNFTPNNQFSLLEVAQAATPTAAAKYRGVVDLSQAGAQAVSVGTSVFSTSTTALSTSSDSFGASFPSFSATQSNDWLLNVATAGNYTLNIQTGANSAVGQIAVSLSDTNKVGTYTLNPGGNYNLVTLSLHAGLNSLSIATLSPFTPVSLSLAPVGGVQLGDLGFEAAQLPTGPNGFQYDPSGTPWTFTGQSGVSGNGTVFTNGNPNAPQGNQVALVQNLGSISQTATNFTAGNYHISLSAAQRGDYGGVQTFQVWVDNTLISTFTPTGTSYQTLTTAPFAATAGPHSIMIKGINASDDATAFVDAISVAPDSTAPVAGASIGDSGFEAAQFAAGSGGYAYGPSGTPWTFTGLAGVSGNGTAFTNANPNAPQGAQVGFIQNQGMIGQSVTNFAAGNYHLSFAAAQRAGYNTQTFQVLIDGAAVGTFNPTNSTYQILTTASFPTTAGTHSITFKGLNASSDATTFLDAVALVQDSTSTVTGVTVGDSSFEVTQLPTGYRGYLYNPTDSPWTFTGQSGVSGNGTTFTNGNPNAPVGNQVAFVQNLGSISQSVNIATAGNYYLSLSAAQRANYGSAQTIQVLVDGVVISTFSPSTTSYQTFLTDSVELTAGAHSIKFQGTYADGDATVFLDGVSMTRDGSTAASSFSDPGFESAQLTTGYRGYAYGPSGTPWTFTGQAGVSGNGTAFTSGNPNAPQGGQVGFIQNQGMISQTVNGMTAGHYSITFSTAQRGSYGGMQSIQVWVDGELIGTFTPSSSTYQTVNTSGFKLKSGTHTFSFQGATNDPDATAFIDNVTLAPQ